MDRRRAERDVRTVVAGGLCALDEQRDLERVLARPLPGVSRRLDAAGRRRRRRPGSRAGPRRRWPASGRRRASTGTSRATAAATDRRDARTPVPPGCGPPAVSTRIRSAPAARKARAASTVPPTGPGGSPASLGRQVEHLPRSAGRAGRRGDRFPAARTGSRRGRSRRSSRGQVLRRGVRGDGDDPRSAAGRAARRTSRARARRPRRARARAACPAPGSGRWHRRPRGPRRATPSASVTPQIFTNGRRATLAGSRGGRPAATNDAHGAAGSAARISASPTSAASNPSARQRATVDGSRTPDSAMTRRSSGTRARRRSARSMSTSSVRRSRLLTPISASAGRERRSSSRSSWASTSGSSPSSSARSTSSAKRRLLGCRTASSSTTSAPAARSDRELPSDRRRTPWPAPGSRRRHGPPQVVDRAAEPVRLAQHRDRRGAAGLVRPRAARRCPRPIAAIRPADGEDRLTSAIRCRPGRGQALGDRPRRRAAAARSASRRDRRELGREVLAPARGDLGDDVRRRVGSGAGGDGHAGAPASDGAVVAASRRRLGRPSAPRAAARAAPRSAPHRWSGPPARGRPRASRPSPPR